MQNAEALLAFAEQWQCLNIAPVRIIVLKWDETSKGKNLYSEIVKARKKNFVAIFIKVHLANLVLNTVPLCMK